MSERERWIVYPLLFLSLGFSMRSSFTDIEFAGEVRCRNLVCESLEAKRNGIISNVVSQRVQVIGKNDKPIVSLLATPKNNSGAVITFDSEGKTTAELRGDKHGGVLLLKDHQRNLSLIAGHDDIVSGIYFNKKALITKNIPLRLLMPTPKEKKKEPLEPKKNKPKSEEKGSN